MTTTPGSGGAREGRARAALGYRTQRAFVAAMFEVLGELAVSASRVDPVLTREIAGFPDGTTIAFTVLGERLSLRLVVREGRFEHAPPDTLERSAIEVVFKHVAHAFALLSFRESTPTAYANDRIVTHGDVPLTMRFVRCLDRVQAIVLPGPVARRALKSVPPLALGEKLSLMGRIVGGAALARVRSGKVRSHS